MNRSRRGIPLICIGLFLLSGCVGLDSSAWLPAPTAVPGTGGTPRTDAQVTFTLIPPDTTPAEAQLAIEFVDIVTGAPYHSEQAGMNRLSDGRWQTKVQIPIGSLVRYRYVTTAAENAVESTVFGEPVRYRLVHVPGPMEVEDRVAAWGQAPYEGPTGRLLGGVRTSDGAPVQEMIVSAAGLQTFTDGQGHFRLDGLPPGLHNVVVYHPEGRYRLAQQGAVIAENRTTPAAFEVRPAEPVTLTFQVTVPGNTPDGLPLRVAGSVRSLGAQFAELPGGVEISPARLPELVPVDASSYIFLTRMYAGTDLRYKYTLGDGLWNAERRLDGSFLTRQLIVPETEATVADTVASWGADGAGEVRFEVAPPQNTPREDHITLQLNPFTWFEPLPMVEREDGSWSYTLRGPLDFADSLDYRYCRNFECGRADSAQSTGDQAPGRPLAPGGEQTLQDTIESWAWWEDPWIGGAAASGDLPERAGWQVGAEIVPRYRPSWPKYDARSMSRVAELNANTVVLTPAWTLPTDRPLPVIEFDPRHARYQEDLAAAAAAADDQGLTVILRPEIRPDAGDLDEWWTDAPRDNIWWSVWFDEYRSFLLTQANLAERVGAARLVITGSQIAPALPDGSLADGSPSGVPLDAESRWRGLIADIRGRFSGEVAFELEIADDLTPRPGFLEAFDTVHVHWHYPLSQDPAAGEDQLTLAAAQGLEQVLLSITPTDRPVHLSVEYLSIEGSAAACPPAAGGGCRASADFDAGAVVDPEIQVDLAAQSRALQAVFVQAAERARIQGFTTRRFYPLAALQDKSASVYGKPAGDMLSFAYARLLGIE